MSAVTPSLPIAARRAGRARRSTELRALARIEGRRVICHPVFLAGLALSMLYLIDVARSGDLRAFLGEWAFLPVAGGTLVAANLAALRSRRDGTDELYDALPRPRSTRVAGQLLGLSWTIPVSGALIAIAVVVAGAPFRPSLAELAAGPAMVVALGAVGILLARVVPSALASPIAVVAIFTAQTAAWESPKGLGAWLLPMINDTVASGVDVPCAPGGGDSGCGMTFTSVLSALPWHVGYLAGLALLAGAAALLPGGRRLPFAVAGALAVALAAATKLAAG
jgi:hypothetical protein